MKKYIPLVTIVLLFGCTTKIPEIKLSMEEPVTLVVENEKNDDKYVPLHFSFICQSIVDSFISRSGSETDNISVVVENTIETDIDMTVDGEKLIVHTSASMKKDLPPTEFQIIHDEDNYIYAVHMETIGNEVPQLTSIAIDTDSGYATFTKNSAGFFVTEMPHSEVIFLRCASSPLL